MAKITITFDSYEDQEELKDALAGTKYAGQLEDIWSQCFRPAIKHGYSQKHIQDIIEMSIMEYINEDGDNENYALDLIDYIGAIYNEILIDND